MPVYNGFLFRDTQNDDGTVPSPGYPYHSPDIITHAQVADPKTYFAANYSADPNQPVQLGSAVNYVYVRAKNLSSNTLSGYKISVFRATASLFMTPSIWKNDPLKTQAGADHVTIPGTVSNGTAVGSEPFLLDALTSANFCVIGMAYNTAEPPIPADFSNYNAYVNWARANQNVCGRNLLLARNFPSRNYEKLDNFSNPEAISVPTLFKVTIHGTLPPNSTFGLTCAPLGIATSWNVNSGNTQTASAMTPANYNGNVTTWATLTTGSWPDGVYIETTVFVGMSSEANSAKYCETEWLELGGKEPEVMDASRPHLVMIGNTTTKFVTSN
jgi:hypothetical protein